MLRWLNVFPEIPGDKGRQVAAFGEIWISGQIHAAFFWRLSLPLFL